MLITISGQSGSGKSTAAKLLSERLDIPTIDIGTIFREMAEKRGMSVIEFGRYVEAHPKIDRELDAAMMRHAKRSKDLILQGRLAGWMSKREGVPAVRIWLAASAKVRAERTARRERIPVRQALADVTRRDRDNRARYRRTYGLDLNDLSIYDIVVRTDNLTIEGVVSSLANELSTLWQTKQKQPKPRKSRSPKRPRR